MHIRYDDLTILDVWGVKPFTPSHNALRGLEAAIRAALLHPYQPAQQAGVARAEHLVAEILTSS